MSLRRHLALLCMALFCGVSVSAQGFETKAKQAFILDHETGLSLFSKKGDEPMVPASMTKMMTAYLVFERIADGSLSLDDELTVSENAWRKGGAASGGSTMFLPIGDQVSVENLLRGVIIQSGNDACIVLAEGISGTEEAFAIEMTEAAQKLGLTSASFKNATGLDEEGHEISPKDLALLAQAIIREHPEMYKLYAETEFTWNGIRQSNRNPLLYRYDGADGLKTGHLSVSGYGLVGSADDDDGLRRIIVLNGLESEIERANEAERMMRAAFREFRALRLFEFGEEVGSVSVFLGTEQDVAVRTAEPVVVGLHRTSVDDLKAEVVYDGPVKAPIEEGAAVGRLVISANGETISSTPVVAASAISKQNFWQRMLTGLAMRLTPA